MVFLCGESATAYIIEPDFFFSFFFKKISPRFLFRSFF